MAYPYGASNALSFGRFSASTLQQPSSIAIGDNAGRKNQGGNAIAIGTLAGQLNQHPSTIVLNATGSVLNTTNDNSIYMAPMRFTTASNLMVYNSTSKEVSYSDTVSGSLIVTGNVGIGTNIPSGLLHLYNESNTTRIVLSSYSDTIGYGPSMDFYAWGTSFNGQSIPHARIESIYDGGDGGWMVLSTKTDFISSLYLNIGSFTALTGSISDMGGGLYLYNYATSATSGIVRISNHVAQSETQYNFTLRGSAFNGPVTFIIQQNGIQISTDSYTLNTGPAQDITGTFTTLSTISYLDIYFSASSTNYRPTLTTFIVEPIPSTKEIMRLGGVTQCVGIGTTAPLTTLHVNTSQLLPTTGILSTRYYLDGPGDNQDGSGTNYDGPWYGMGWSGIPGLNGSPYVCLAGFAGVAMRSGGGYIQLTDTGNVGIGITSPTAKFQVGTVGAAYNNATTNNTVMIVGSSVQPSTSGEGTKAALFITTDDAAVNNRGAGIGFGGRQSYFGTNTMFARISGVNNSAVIAGDMVFEVNYNNTGGMYERMRLTGYGGGSSYGNGALILQTDYAYKPTSSSWMVGSDRRVKENIIDADIDRCVELIKLLPLKRYTYKEEYYPQFEVEDRSRLGWIAQDVMNVFPKSVVKRPLTYHRWEKITETRMNPTTGVMEEVTYNKPVEDFVLDDFHSLDSSQLHMVCYGAVQKLISENEKKDKQLADLQQQLDEYKQQTEERFDKVAALLMSLQSTK